MEQHIISYYIGLSIIIASHVYILYKPNSIDSLEYHSYANLLAALFIAYYFLFKEKYITY